MTIATTGLDPAVLLQSGIHGFIPNYLELPIGWAKLSGWLTRAA
jgi:hypothetical protein